MTVNAYIDSFPKDVQERLVLVRKVILKMIPEAEEAISYGIIGYKIHGKPIVYFGAWKTYLSIYPIPDGLAKAMPDLGGAKISGRATLQLPFSKPLSVKVVEDVVRFVYESRHSNVDRA